MDDIIKAIGDDPQLESLKIPRLYQAELIKEAKKRNLIIRADTGAGKTLVALELLKWMARQPRDRHQIQAFLVPTRPLVHQQAQYIQSQSDLRVHALTGDLQPELWNVERWHSELDQIDILVCTAQIFYDLLSKGHWDIQGVSLLIFDEAHHCRKNHIYNQIMKTFYHRLPRQLSSNNQLPKILGLTASPIWDFRNLEKAEQDVKNLQSCLAAQLYEVKINIEDVKKHNFKPTESAVYFEPCPAFEKLTTPPWDQINPLLDLHANERVFMDIESVNTELGHYATILYIADWLKYLLIEGNKNQVSSGRLLDPSHREEIEGVIDRLNNLVMIDEIPDEQLSPKVRALNKILLRFMIRANHHEFQGIVFVQRRRHTQLLTSLFSRNPHLKHLIRAVALTGHGGQNNRDCGSVKMDSKMQNKTISKLHSGEFNLTVATSIAEEGLDFQSCMAVIRFDEITTWKGYIQSRGRARKQNSEYIIMLPMGSSSKFFEFSSKEDELRATIFDRPEDEIIEEAEVELTPQLICRLTNGKDSILTYFSAPGLLNDVCQLIPQDEFLPALRPEYELWSVGENYQSTVTLPPMAALPPSERKFTGLELPTKRDAKRSAAFEACKVLRSVGVLNEHFLPHREDKTDQMRDASGRQLDNSKIPDPVEAIVPNIWGDMSTLKEVWLHKFSFRENDRAESISVGLLCAHRLNFLDGLHLYDHFQQSQPLPIRIEEFRKQDWSQDDFSTNLNRLKSFTRSVIQIAINRKSYDGKLLFFIAPLVKNTCEIDWSLVEAPTIPIENFEDLSRCALPIAPLPALHFRLYDTCVLAEDILTSLSYPRDVPRHPNMADFQKKAGRFKTLSHCYRVIYGLAPSKCEGPLVYLETEFDVMDNLSKSKPILAKPYRILLPLKVCQGTLIPKSLWKVFSYLPSLTRIVHDASQVTSLLRKLDLTDISIRLGIEALTQPGLGTPWDYQTLETVGDAFLKLATTVHVYLTRLKMGEGDMSLLRSRSVDNAYLRRKALEANLPAFVLSQRFRTDRFRDAQSEDGKELPDGNFLRKIPKRVLSDVVEALLGAGYLSGNAALGLRVGTAFDLCFGGTTPWGERELKLSFGVTAGNVVPEMFSKYEELERKIGYRYKEKLLLVQALTHRSANSFMTNCYEREEWLGDAVIDMWIVEHAYKSLKEVTAERLTIARARVVSNGSLGYLAIKKLGLHELINHRSEAFKQACAESLETLQEYERPEDYYSNLDNLFVVFDPPKILNDALEAIIGTIFIDSGFELGPVYRTLDRIFEDVLPGLPQLIGRDPLSRMLLLRDQLQCNELKREQSTIMEPHPDGPDKEPLSTKVCRIAFHGEEIAIGRHASSVAVAEQRAALAAVQALETCMQPVSEGSAEPLMSRCQCKQASTVAGGASTTTAQTKSEVGAIINEFED